MSPFPAASKHNDDPALQARLVELVMNRLTEHGDRIRAEDAVCGAAVIVAERCIDAAGDYPLRDHALAPGQRVFSDRVNQLLCGNVTADVPADSVFGRLKALVDPTAYAEQYWPELTDVFRHYAAAVGQPADWGKAPLTVPEPNRPRILPLRFAYETRADVDDILRPVAADKPRCLRIAVGALADLLHQVAGVLAPGVGLTLAFEVINGMAKTAPMTEKALRAAQAEPAGRR